jgi:inositol-phosphate phosphatase / L-galactose 1-phosphate phosphatase / histidinol-phosphatase
MNDIDRWIATAIHMADQAAAITPRYFRTSVAVDHKQDRSPVSIADREVETALRAIIRETLPDHGFIGEEHGSHRPDSSHVWVIDPIDGTKAFLTGRPSWGTLIALCRDGAPILGVICCAALGERWVGASGRQTLYRARAGEILRPIRTRPCPNLGDALLATTSPDMFSGADLAPYQRLRAATRFTAFGGDCYCYGLVACGYADLVIEADLKPYDYLALAPVLTGAGGAITDWRGRALGLDSDGHVLASGDPGAHIAALEVLSG